MLRKRNTMIDNFIIWSRNCAYSLNKETDSKTWLFAQFKADAVDLLSCEVINIKYLMLIKILRQVMTKINSK